MAGKDWFWLTILLVSNVLFTAATVWSGRHYRKMRLDLAARAKAEAAAHRELMAAVETNSALLRLQFGASKVHGYASKGGVA